MNGQVNRDMDGDTPVKQGIEKRKRFIACVNE